MCIKFNTIIDNFEFKFIILFLYLFHLFCVFSLPSFGLLNYFYYSIFSSISLLVAIFKLLSSSYP